jgi:tetratricopeptide (TPR) repeat protein
LDLKKQVRLPDRKLSEDELAEAFRGSRALLLDRLSGNLYFGRADNVRIYLMAVATETDGDETDSEVFEADLEGAAEYRSIPAHVVDDFRRSLDENFATPEAQWALGDWYLRRHDGSWALKLYDRASRRKTDLLEDYSNVASLGYACVLAREEERAIDAFKRAIEADPHNPEAYGHLALVQASRREAVEAQSNARKAVEMAPDDPNSHIRLGQVLFMTDSGQRR